MRCVVSSRRECRQRQSRLKRSGTSKRLSSCAEKLAAMKRSMKCGATPGSIPNGKLHGSDAKQEQPGCPVSEPMKLCSVRFWTLFEIISIQANPKDQIITVF